MIKFRWYTRDDLTFPHKMLVKLTQGVSQFIGDIIGDNEDLRR